MKKKNVLLSEKFAALHLQFIDFGDVIKYLQNPVSRPIP